MSGSARVATASTPRFVLILIGVGGFLDAYTYLTRGGVFANTQTGNVILLATSGAAGEWHRAVAHLWSILAFVVGVLVATVLRTWWRDATSAALLVSVTTAQALVLGVVAAVPAEWPNVVVTVPIAFVAAMQMELFRTIGGMPIITIATTGNLMRFVESVHALLTQRDAESRRRCALYSAVVAAFAGGAVVGAIVSRWLGTPAVALCAVAMIVVALFVVHDARQIDADAPEPEG
ncbi:MAG: YoaK family protein [Corynebacteriales bacterium]|nr:YoaK family protein [Mycobacteriales bacterium]